MLMLRHDDVRLWWCWIHITSWRLFFMKFVQTWSSTSLEWSHSVWSGKVTSLLDYSQLKSMCNYNGILTHDDGDTETLSKSKYCRFPLDTSRIWFVLVFNESILKNTWRDANKIQHKILYRILRLWLMTNKNSNILSLFSTLLQHIIANLSHFDNSNQYPTKMWMLILLTRFPMIHQRKFASKKTFEETMGAWEVC